MKTPIYWQSFPGDLTVMMYEVTGSGGAKWFTVQVEKGGYVKERKPYIRTRAQAHRHFTRYIRRVNRGEF